MGAFQARLFAPAQFRRRSDRPLIVVGITHSQTCLVLRGRLRALREAGFRVALICSPGDLLQRVAAEEEIDSIPIPMERSFSPFADLVALFRICATLLRLKPAMTEFSTPKAGLLGSIAALVCGVPRRVYLLRGLRLETASGWRRCVLALCERVSAGSSHVVLCTSHSLRKRAVGMGLTSLAKAQVLGEGSSSGVDVEHFAPAAEDSNEFLPIRCCGPVIGFVGRLTRDKGIPELLTAFERILLKIPEAWLLLVGWFDESDDALPAALRSAISQHPRILRTGFVADVANWYHRMDVMVLPTLREGFPNAVLEAAASGIPVVTTLATGARDAVVPGVTGLLIAPGDSEAIADAVLKLLADPDRRRRMGRSARTWVSQRFSRPGVLARTTAFYQAMIDEPTGLSSGVLARDEFAVD